MESSIQMQVIFIGRVQGVFFRYTTVQKALSMGLLGTVRNCSDGSVVMIVQGDLEGIEELIAYLTGDSGPGLVSSLTKTIMSKRTDFLDFRIIRS
jgi:acylphosphatase